MAVFIAVIDPAALGTDEGAGIGFPEADAAFSMAGSIENVKAPVVSRIAYLTITTSGMMVKPTAHRT